MDTDEISRLRNELGVLKRQMRDKDRMFSTQIQRLADAVERQMRDNQRLADAVERQMRDNQRLADAVERVVAQSGR